MNTKFFTLLFTVVVSIGTLIASNMQVNGIWYDFNENTHTASVISGSFKYSGSIIIPTTVIYNSTSYKVTTIGYAAFENCTDLKSVTIPHSVIEIAEGAFRNCSSLTSITIPDSVTWIGPSAFSNCESLTSVTIPNSVTYIGVAAFANCIGLPVINGLRYADTYLVGVADAMAYTYTIKNGTKWIGFEAFNSCSNLKSIDMPNSITEIGMAAFIDCTNLTSITIPNSVTSIDNNAFDGCINLTSITIPNTVTWIGHRAFADCANLTSIIVPNSVTKIGFGAFNGCIGLVSAIIGNSVIEIDGYAFYNCRSLKEIHYPQGLDLTHTQMPSTTKLVAYNPHNPPQEVLLATSGEQQQPPLLVLVDNTLSFSDASGNNRIEANEQSAIRFKLHNNGKGPAANCETRVKMSGTTDGITVVTYTLPTIAVGQTYEVAIPVSTNINTKDGKVTFTIEVYEPNGWGVAPFDLTVVTKAFEPPLLQVVDYNITSSSGKIQKMIPFTLSFNLQNTKYGDAELVKVKINLPSNVFVMDGLSELSFPQIKSGEVKQISVTLAANNNYSTTDIPVKIDIKEKYGKFAENKQLNIALNQSVSSSINIAAKDEPKQERKEIQLAMMTSDVDRNIPKTDIQNKNTFVVIIANENYQQVAAVPFALNDGKIFRQYCEQTLGISPKHIREYPNATGNQIKYSVNLLREKVEEYDNPNIIFYYAGHGIPDEQSKTAYLLPVDGILNDLSTCYKLDDLYSALGDLPAGQISVFMDACFSGSKREQGMLAAARGVALKAKAGQPKGNMVVFSAAQGDETAYPYSSKQHGMFTYYLLKKLQETKGDVTLQQLGDYIIKEVRRQSIEENDKKQTPCVTPASAVADIWQNWKLK